MNLLPWPALFPLAAVLSGLLTALLLQGAPRLGLVDYPAERKFHRRPTPKGGGLAIFAAVAVTAGLGPGGLDRRALVLLGVGLFVVALGLADDLRPLPWQLRLVVQTAAALAAVFLWPVEMTWPARLLGAFWVVALLNALNLLDNMDALSGSVAWIAAGFLALACLIGHAGANGQPAAVLLALMGALSGFLWFNRPPARIFLGDAGSTFLGFTLGLASLDPALDRTTILWSWLVPVCILAVPWYDMTSVVLLRLRQGRSPFHGDKQHLSHRLVDLGLSPPAAVGVIDLLALASGTAGLVLYEVVTARGAALVGLALAVWWAALAILEFGARARRQP